MRCNNLVLALWLCGALVACSNHAEKPAAANHSAASKPAGLNPAEAQSPDAKPAPGTAIAALPAGPATANPYLQTNASFSEQATVNFHDAVMAMQQKNWSHAEAVLVALAEKNPRLSGVYLNLGIVYRAQGKTDRAAEAFQQAISANLKNVDAYNQLAVLKREAGDFTAAEALYQKALAIWPFYPAGHKNIAILYELYMGKPEQALPHYLAYQQLLGAPDKQLESWIADLQRRLNSGKTTNTATGAVPTGS